MTNEDTPLPNALDAEMAVLGAAVLSPDAAAVMLERLTSHHFVRGAHQHVFEAIEHLSERGEPTDATAVKLLLDKRKLIHLAGGAPYLHTLIESACTPSQVGYFADQILDRAEQAALLTLPPRITQIATDPGLDRADRVDAVWRAVEAATETGVQVPATSAAELISPLIESLEAGDDGRGVTTGWSDIDQLLTRLRPGQLITIGARPGIGKTVAMANIAHHVALKLGLPVYFATLEMSAQELLMRMVAHEAKVSLHRLQQPTLLTEDDWRRLARAHSHMSEATSLIIDDDPAIGIGHIRARLRAMRRARTPAALVVVDYLQLMTSGKRTESRQIEVGQLSRGLKLLAKEFAVPVVVGSQLNRGVEQRNDKKPLLADLRESGSVEQDSDVVVLLHREDAYDKESARSGEIDLIVAKHRNGPTATITAAFQGHYARIADMAPEPAPPRAPGHLRAVPN